MSSETKINIRFPISQLLPMTGYSIPFRLNWKSRGGGKIFLVKQLRLTVILIFRGFCGDKFKKKMVNFLVYNPHKNNITNQFKNICRTQGKINVIRNLNSKPEEKGITEFL